MSDDRTAAERVATLLDGRLHGAARDEMIARVAASEEERALLAETAAVLREMEGGGASDENGDSLHPDPPHDVSLDAEPAEPTLGVSGRPTLQPKPVKGWRRPRARWMALAAAVAAVALGSLVWRSARGGEAPGAVQLADAVAAPAQAVQTAAAGGRPWQTTLGNGSSATGRALAVRMGVVQTDLALARRASDTAAVRRFATEAAALLNAVPASSSVAARYRALGGAPASAADPTDLFVATEELLGRDEVRTGAWLEAARLAAASRDAAFFRTRESQVALSQALRTGNLSARQKGAFGDIADSAPRWDVLLTELDDAARSTSR